MPGNERIEKLLAGFISGTLTESEQAELASLTVKLDGEELSGLLSNAWEQHDAAGMLFTPHESNAILQRILHGNERNKKVVPLYRQNWFRLAVAAVFVIAVSLPFVWKWQGANPVPAANSTAAQHILPGGNKAVLLLADGSAVELDSAHNGALSVQGSTQVVKLADGQLAYRGKNGVPAEMMYNTISTPRGGQYRLTLADGSQVWLNAASQLRFPVAFGSAERRVELLGEAYFEVAKSNAPFKVLVAGKSEVEVLGTHFNINSYADEAAISTTLLEGSVRVSKPGGGDFVTLQPGQQARVNEKIDVLTGVDTDEMVAWKEGWFHFNRADVGAIMRQVSRWYDVDVVFEGNARKKTFSGIVSRSNDVGEVLRIMETAGVRFRIEGKRITVIQ